jgi:hypothetical protein
MTVEQWIEKNFKHDKPENVWYNGKYREDRVIYWQVYNRWLDCGNDIDKLWLDYEQGCQWDLFCRLPKEFLTRDFCVSLCEEIIEHFGIYKERNAYWWVEKDGKIKSHNDGFGWHGIVGSLLYKTALAENGIRYADHPDAWKIIWSRIPHISIVIEDWSNDNTI